MLGSSSILSSALPELLDKYSASSINTILRSLLNDDLLIPYMIVDDSGLIFKSSYFFKINELNLNFLIKKFYNKLITPQLRLKQSLVYYKTTKLI